MANILVIDDDAALRMFIKAALTYEGYNVEVAKDALQGLVFMTNNKLPDLVITDLIMSTMDGCALLKKMRSDYRLRDIPAIIMTGSITRVNAFPPENDFQALLIKPFNLEDLLVIVARLTRKGIAAR